MDLWVFLLLTVTSSALTSFLEPVSLCTCGTFSLGIYVEVELLGYREGEFFFNADCQIPSQMSWITISDSRSWASVFLKKLFGKFRYNLPRDPCFGTHYSSHTWISKEWEMNTLFLAMRIIFVCPSIGPQERLLLVSSQIRFPGLCTHRPAAGSVGFWGLPAAHLQRTAFSRNHQPEGCDLFAPPSSSKLSLRLTETGV